MKKKYLRFRIMSDSMIPLLKVGEEIIWDKIENPAQQLRRFDLILFRRGTLLFCHYLWKINARRDLYITKPLKNIAVEDLPLKSSDILGRLVSHRLNYWWRFKILFFYWFKRF